MVFVIAVTSPSFRTSDTMSIYADMGLLARLACSPGCRVSVRRCTAKQTVGELDKLQSCFKSLDNLSCNIFF